VNDEKLSPGNPQVGRRRIEGIGWRCLATASGGHHSLVLEAPPSAGLRMESGPHLLDVSLSGFDPKWPLNSQLNLLLIAATACIVAWWLKTFCAKRKRCSFLRRRNH